MGYAMRRAIASNIVLRLDPAQAHIDVPARSAIVQGKHQPLQWNIGSVQR